MMQHIMVDIESLGTRAGCAVVSIGAVAFDPTTNTLGPTFYIVVNRASCRALGLHEDQSTLAWWRRQSEEAREVLIEAESIAAPTIPEVLEAFSTYLKPFPGTRRMWSCGADFDLPIIAHLYAITGRPLPWRYTNNRCYRTLRNLVPVVQDGRQGTHHNALHDAIHQAAHAMQCLAYLSRLYREEARQQLQASVAA